MGLRTAHMTSLFRRVNKSINLYRRLSLLLAITQSSNVPVSSTFQSICLCMLTWQHTDSREDSRRVRREMKESRKTQKETWKTLTSSLNKKKQRDWGKQWLSCGVIQCEGRLIRTWAPLPQAASAPFASLCGADVNTTHRRGKQSSERQVLPDFMLEVRIHQSVWSMFGVLEKRLEFK